MLCVGLGRVWGWGSGGTQIFLAPSMDSRAGWPTCLELLTQSPPGWHRGRSVPSAEGPGAPTSATCYLNSRSSIQSPATRSLKTPCSQSHLSVLGDSGRAALCPSCPQTPVLGGHLMEM